MSGVSFSPVVAARGLGIVFFHVGDEGGELFFLDTVHRAFGPFSVWRGCGTFFCIGGRGRSAS